ncbi:MAG: hypothetical protein WKG01_05085 [Kofleriaceae bacterium]
MTLFPVVCLIVACGDPAPPPAPDAAPTERGFELADVVAPVTAEELELAAASWAAQDLTPQGVVTEASGTTTFGAVTMNFRVLSHLVAGQRHYFAVLVPAGLTGPAPVLIYTHGAYTGEGGFPYFAVEDLQVRIPGQPIRGELIYVVPSYRGERIRIANVTYTSEGAPQIGTTDVLDVATALSVTLAETPQADPTRVGVFGESRGGIVALALGAQDDRIDLVIEAFAPTDFRIALAGVDAATFAGSVMAAVADPANPAHLLTRSLIPIDQVTVVDGALRITTAGFADMRRRMSVTSALDAPLDLPALQVHHGTADTTSLVQYSRVLRDVMAAAGRPSPSPAFTYFEYDGGGHDLGTLPGSIGRIGDAITLHLAP